MALEDFIEPEVGVAVALTAAVASPQVRSVLRRGAVYGLAGILMAGDAVSSLAQGVKRGAQKATAAVETPGVSAPEAVTSEAATSEAAISEVAAPEILSEDAPAAEALSPVGPTSGTTEPAPSVPKRTRKTAEAADNE